jgi:FixJ family two-component response regulator
MCAAVEASPLAPNSTIFIVVTDPVVRDSLRVLLEAHQLLVSGHGSFQDFLERYRSSGHAAPGCLLLDLDVPGKSGPEGIRTLSGCIDIPTIVMTSHGTDAIKRQAQRAGVVALIDKPYTDLLLLSHIRQALGRTGRATH